ncbi:MerR family transcriptional regulator, partial [Frankia tisae]
MSHGERLTSREVADRLGVKLETVYAYASRGLLHSRRAAGERGSTFDPAEVERLRTQGHARARAATADGTAAAANPAPTAAATAAASAAAATTVAASGVAVPAGADLPAVRTRLTLVVDGRLYYRGVDAIAFVADHSFEDVAGWLWRGRTDPAMVLSVSPDLAATLERVGGILPARSRLTDRLRVAVSVAAASDPLRFDLREDSVLLTARTLVAALVEALPTPPEVPPVSGA